MGGSSRAIAVLFSIALLLITSTRADAAATSNVRIDVATTVVNSCAPSDGPIAFTGFVHVMFRETSDGFHIHNNWHLAGVSANGTRYTLVRTVELDSKTASFSHTQRVRLLSQGPSDNEHFLLKAQFPPGTFTIETDCRG